MLGIDFSNGSLKYLLELIMGPGPKWGMSYGPYMLKKCIFGKIQNAARAYMVHQRKRLENKKKFVSMSYTWSVPTFVHPIKTGPFRATKTDL